MISSADRAKYDGTKHGDSKIKECGSLCMKNHFKNAENKIFVAGLLIIILIAAIFCFAYVCKLEKTMDKETNRYLDELSQHISEMIEIRIRTVFRDMNSFAETYTAMEEQEARDYLDSKKKLFGFDSLEVVEQDGLLSLSDGKTVSIERERFFQAALQGGYGVSDSAVSPLCDNITLMYAVPLKKGAASEISQVLVGNMPLGTMQAMLNVSSFHGEGFSRIIDSDGNFISGSNCNNEILQGYNFYQVIRENKGVKDNTFLEAMKKDVEQGKNGVLYFKLDGDKEMAMSYTPLKINDWYLLLVVPVEAAQEYGQNFLHWSIVLNIFIILVFLALLCLVVYIQRKANHHLKRLAYIDDVTGGMNRIWFEEVAQEQIAKAPAGTYALVSLDIQKFKLINDAFGSAAGDRTLKYIYDVICKSLVDNEYAARISADTYNLLIQNDTQKRLVERMEQLAQEINSFNQYMSPKYFLPVREGIYVIDETGLNMIIIQDRANVARKNNKEISQSRVSSCMFYQEIERLRLIREKEIDNHMEVALENGEFSVYLQPKISLKDNCVAGAEALVRWIDPVKGIIPPNDFVPVFEKNGFIVKIDLFVFEQVCKTLERWKEEGKKIIPISVNLSRAHLNHPDFLEPFLDIFRKFDLSPSLIEIELTETFAFENFEAFIEVIQKIHNAGFACSLDDFGSGYSSLNMLKDMPADVLKLDKAFFSTDTEGNGSERGQCVVESVINLAKRLEMNTVSEGIETMEQVDFLRQAQCDMVQGYIFSRPLPIEEFEKLFFGDGAFWDEKISENEDFQ